MNREQRTNILTYVLLALIIVGLLALLAYLGERGR